jgi:hypothetical protein
MTKTQQDKINAVRAERNRKVMQRVSVAVLIPLMLVSGLMSYGHITEVSLMVHMSSLYAHLMAVPVDAMLIIEAIVIIAENVKGITMAKAGFTIAMIASLGANMLAASAHPSIVGYIGAGLPSVALIWSSHGLLRLFIPAPKKTNRRKPAKRAVAPRTVRGHLHPEAVTVLR